MNRSKALILLSVIAIAAMLGTWCVTAYAADSGGETSNGFRGMWRWRRLRARGRGIGRVGFVEVSEEFEVKVINIAENDADVQGLLADGYSIAGVRPIIKSVVDANGDVTTKATNAVVILKNEDAKSLASVWVDLNAETVTKIVTLTRTVIEKT